MAIITKVVIFVILTVEFGMSLVKDLLGPVIEYSYAAGKIVLDFYNSQNFSIKHKDDHSLLTDADLAVHNYLLAKLSSLTPEFAIVSEEGSQLNAKVKDYYWLIDPLDGTQEFVNRSGEFSINIALIAISTMQPVLGVIYAPALDELYYSDNNSAYCHKQGKLLQLHSSGITTPYRLVISRRGLSQTSLAKLSFLNPYQLLYCGSALKLCWVASNRADFYPCFGQIGPWDTAAGHCLLKALGGDIISMSGGSLTYPPDRIKLPPFYAALSPKLLALACG